MEKLSVVPCSTENYFVVRSNTWYYLVVRRGTYFVMFINTEFLQKHKTFNSLSNTVALSVARAVFFFMSEGSTFLTAFMFIKLFFLISPILPHGALKTGSGCQCEPLSSRRGRGRHSSSGRKSVIEKRLRWVIRWWGEIGCGKSLFKKRLPWVIRWWGGCRFAYVGPMFAVGPRLADISPVLVLC